MRIIRFSFLPKSYPVFLPAISVCWILLLCGFLFPSEDAVSRMENYSGPAGLRPRVLLPEGVSLQCSDAEVRIDVRWANPSDQESLSFYLILPPAAPKDAEVVDYRLVPRGSASEGDQESVTASGAVSSADAAGMENFDGDLAIRRMVVIQDEGTVRFYRLVRVTVQSRLIALGERGAYVPESLSLRIPFPEPVEPDPVVASEPVDWGFARVLSRLVANPEALALYGSRAYAVENVRPSLTDPWRPDGQGTRWFRILVREDGLYSISHNDFRQAGLDPESIDPRSVRVYSRDREVPSLLLGGIGSSFQPGNALVFHGFESESTYSRERAYWVRVGEMEPAPLRMEREGLPGTYETLMPRAITTIQERVFEQDEKLIIQHGNFLSIREKEWVWKEIAREGSTTVGFDLPGRDPRSTESIPFALDLYVERPSVGSGFAAPRILPIEVRINDILTTTIAAERSAMEGRHALDLPAEMLQERGNVLDLRFAESVESPLGSPAVYLDRFSVNYRRGLIAQAGRLPILTEGVQGWHKMVGFPGAQPLLFDVTDPARPTLLDLQLLPDGGYAFFEERAGRRLLAVTSSAIQSAGDPAPALPDTFLDPANEADYLIIYHPRFEEQIRPLARLQEQRGLKVFPVRIDALFQAFAHGESTPHAIKDFLTYALRTWHRPPTYVCLVGDATSDYRDELRSGVENLVPAYSYSAAGNETWASELWYSTLLGSDLLPDVMLGRISAQSVEDAAEMVRKVVTYTEGAPLGPWRSRLAYCADDSGFRSAVDTLYQDFRPEAYGNARIYLEEFPYEDNFYLSVAMSREKNLKVSTATTMELLHTYNRGVVLMSFFGHGSPNIWTDERIWFGGDSQNSDNLNLRNADRLPFVMTYTCNHGAFDYPMPRWDICISEDMMRVRKGGAVGLYVPSGPGITSIHEKVAHAFSESVFRDGLRRVGEAIALTSMNYLLGGNPPEMIRMFVLLGDPALDLALPANSAEGQVTPEVVDAIADVRMRREMVFEGASEGVSRGRFVASLYDGMDKEVFQSSPIRFFGGRIRWTFHLPENAEPGLWTVRVYYADPRTGEDGLLHRSFQVTRPVVRLASLAAAHEEPATGQPMALRLGIQNEQPIFAGGVPITLLHEDGHGRLRTVISLLEDLEPDERKELEVPWRVEAGLHRFVARTERYARPLGDQEEGMAGMDFVLFQPDPRSDAIWSLPSLVQAQWESAQPTARINMTIPFYVDSMFSAGDYTARLENRSGDVLAATDVSILPEDVGKRSPKRISFRVEFDPAAEANTFLFALASVGKSGPVFRMEVPVGQPTLPNLRVVPGSVSFHPQAPQEGETIFLRALLENTGPASSGRFYLRLSSPDTPGHERDGALLFPHPDLRQLDQASLAPGARRWVNLRWDYDAFQSYAGEAIIRLRIDPTGQIAEIDKTNNYVDTPLRILQRPAVRVVSLDEESHDAGPDASMVRISVTVMNEGEATASNRRLGFFNRLPLGTDDLLDPEVLVKDIQLPPLAGGESLVYSHQWRVDLSDPRTSPTATVYQPTQAIRAGLLDEEIPAEF